ncbi:polyamine ABC transporter substrate-binding protein (plasmid) [Agrobacterium tumefaciens]|uniref:Polyamine ABC transporter substrate-binding protein n=3 Tax=Agrobacterium TaxID=357 RepID=A0AAE6EIK8_AGRTU|nr:MULTISPECIES: ABC transporter substrate-binding protein [Agrobacterium tumefaciens complex]CUX71250.1 LecA [Agrobacterium sp. NCPPB 925]ASK40585.1 polyamine ABC transporter substrate-binding protein [Agrobacterium genomosp. 6]ASK41348.1 polyamine ABC transporter substrate-binding protein [Agrobacterium genomosp. 6]QCL77597.1 polyamine ABC transporter substrate-binding protein [Agrobacterium tumefaciens]QCL83087.1 polyamine ABC transporter substrate-binding protein [Agrobacterium tumefaciens
MISHTGKLNLSALIATFLSTAALPCAAEAATLRVGAAAENVATLDPTRATATVDVGVVSWMFNGLVRFPPGSADPTKIEPDLAEKWETTPDGLVWTFHLRNGVKFHGDYGTVTSEDVVYSLERAKNPKTSSFSNDFTEVKSIEAIDPLTVKITLNSPVPGFLGLIANYHGGNIISKKAAEKLGADFKLRPIGTGPFMFENAVTQQSVTLKAFPDYFRGKPKLDGIQYNLIPSDASRELAFRSGELDLIYGKREQRWVDQAKAWDGSTVDIFAPGEYRTLFLNQAHKPLDNVKVRQAIAHAVNVDQIVEFVGAGVGQKGCSVVPPGFLGEDCTWSYKYDPELSRKLLTEAGLGNGLTIKAIVSSATAQQPIMQVVQGQLSEVGINMDMQVADHATYQEQSRKDLSDVVFYGAARYPVADSYLSQFYHSNASIGKPTAVTNFSHCDAADAEIEAGRKAATDPERLKAWSDAQHKIYDQVCGIPLFNLMQVWVRKNELDYGYELEGALNLAPPITENTTFKQ